MTSDPWFWLFNAVPWAFLAVSYRNPYLRLVSVIALLALLYQAGLAWVSR